MQKNKIVRKITYLTLIQMLVLGAIFAIKSADAEDEPIYRDGVCIDHCEEDDDDDEEDADEDRDESQSEEEKEERIVNKTYTVIEPARTVTSTVMKTKVIIDTDQDGIPDEKDPHPNITEIYVVSDDNRNGISDWLER